MTAVDECQIVRCIAFQVVGMVEHRKSLAKHCPLSADQVFQIGWRPRSTRTVLHQPHHCCHAHAADRWRRIGAQSPRADPCHERRAYARTVGRKVDASEDAATADNGVTDAMAQVTGIHRRGTFLSDLGERIGEVLDDEQVVTDSAVVAVDRTVARLIPAKDVLMDVVEAPSSAISAKESARSSMTSRSSRIAP